jgi:hypothetical protein
MMSINKPCSSIFFNLISFILCLFLCAPAAEVGTVSAGAPSSRVTPTGEQILVTNISEDINGDTSSPAALKANPGPDGISLPEAMRAAEATVGYETITFDASLLGSVIHITGSLPFITQGNLVIDGNIDSNATPDITIDGTGAAGFNGFDINGASNVVIKGLTIQNYKKHGVNITPDAASGKNLVENIVLYQNTISNMPYAAISVMPYTMQGVIIRNVEIISNTLQNCLGGVSVIAGMGSGSIDNEISGVSIINNTIDNPGRDIGIFVSTSTSVGLTGNTIRDIEIRGNRLLNHYESTILIAGSNDALCHNNTVDGVVIADNYIDSSHVAIEFVTEAGANSTNNRVTNVSITGNTMVSGGIHFGGATGYGANHNTTSNVLIASNHIRSSYANGIYLAAGSDGALNNLFENIVLQDNFVVGSRDCGILLTGNDWNSPGNQIRNVAITNQTLVDNGIGSSWASGLSIHTRYVGNPITGVTIANTILWGNGFGDIIRGSETPDSVINSLLTDSRFVGSNGNFYQNPQFVNPSTGDYHLQSTSPCVDTGDPVAAGVSPKDLDGNVRVWDGNGDTISVVDLGAWEYNASLMQEINVLGGSVSILNGDLVPVTWDGTDLGGVVLGESPAGVTFSIENLGDEPLNLSGIPRVSIGGADAVDFSVVTQPGTVVPGGGSLTFTVTFSPSAVGIRRATISIANDDSDEAPYTFAIQGMGVAPTFKVFLPLID